jgi:SAM-dependent methyltransferase
LRRPDLALTPEFCAAGAALTAWTYLSDRLSFVRGSALDIPCADGRFDLVWTQHAAMNIADTPRLCAEIHRMLRPGGRFALFDTMAGPVQPTHFPLSWASDPAYSVLLPPDEVRALVTANGFAVRVWIAGVDLVAGWET